MRRRREVAAAAFIERRRQLGLTQEDIAHLADVVAKTVYNFEVRHRWPNSRTRARLEQAVDWPQGEIERIAGPSRPPVNLPPELLEQAQQLRNEVGEETFAQLMAFFEDASQLSADDAVALMEHFRPRRRPNGPPRSAAQ